MMFLCYKTIKHFNLRWKPKYLIVRLHHIFFTFHEHICVFFLLFKMQSRVVVSTFEKNKYGIQRRRRKNINNNNKHEILKCTKYICTHSSHMFNVIYGEFLFPNHRERESKQANGFGFR